MTTAAWIIIFFCVFFIGFVAGVNVEREIEKDERGL